jgi:hypothetical protein
MNRKSLLSQCKMAGMPIMCALPLLCMLLPLPVLPPVCAASPACHLACMCAMLPCLSHHPWILVVVAVLPVPRCGSLLIVVCAQLSCCHCSCPQCLCRPCHLTLFPSLSLLPPCLPHHPCLLVLIILAMLWALPVILCWCPPGPGPGLHPGLYHHHCCCCCLLLPLFLVPVFICSMLPHCCPLSGLLWSACHHSGGLCLKRWGS